MTEEADKYNGIDALPNIFRIWGVTNQDDLETALENYRNEKIAEGIDPSVLPESVFVRQTRSGLFGFDPLVAHDWKFLISLKDGRVEEIIVRAKTPKEAIRKIKKANTNDRSRAIRWNNNVNVVTVELPNNEYGPYQVDKFYFDSETNYDSLYTSFEAAEFPSRFDPYATNENGRAKSNYEANLYKDSDGNDIETQENVFSDTEPEPKSSSSDIASEITDNEIPELADVDIEQIRSLSIELGLKDDV